ncbi:hypothetical protein ACFZBU_11800 [Embleya sp. NPDC008237]|uniref:hypothetical protein n=1 Tax=Embleya sp. NPDC008237 TaxID=3363978 RepID=UPI0036DFEEEC
MAILGQDVFRSDLLATSGLDDRKSREGVPAQAQELMAEAIHARHTFFSTCGSSLSVESAMLSVTGPHQKPVISRDAHKSVVSGLILSGVRPIWVEPTWDPELHLAPPPQPRAYAAAFAEHPDARGALVTSPTPYCTCADLAAIAEVRHARRACRVPGPPTRPRPRPAPDRHRHPGTGEHRLRRRRLAARAPPDQSARVRPSPDQRTADLRRRRPHHLHAAPSTTIGRPDPNGRSASTVGPLAEVCREYVRAAGRRDRPARNRLGPLA